MTSNPPSPIKYPQNWRLHAPNALTILRLLLAILFVALLSTFNADADLSDTIPSYLLLAAATIFITAALTDALDGHLARKWNAISPFGRVMDPFADKILILAAFILLAAPPFTDQAGHQLSAIQPWMAILILARELLVTSIRGVVEGAGGSFAASASGKAKMVIQSIAVPLILITLAIPTIRLSTPAQWLLPATAWAVTLITLWSALPYILRARKALSTTPTR